MKPIRIGTRGSRLALWQAHWVEDRLCQHGLATQIVEIGTSGDLNRRQPVADLGAEGVFTKEIQRALLRAEVDLAVHSLKDLPTELVEGLSFAASPPRGPFRDAFVSNGAAEIDALPEGAIIGTGSVRRKAQLLHWYGTRFEIVDIRGNVETRLQKLDAGGYDAIILAEAGLLRLGLATRITSLLEPPKFLPAIAQGALGIEIRTCDAKILGEAVDCLNDWPTYAAVTAERSLLRSLRGGCLAPIAAHATVAFSSGDLTAANLTLHARVLSSNGKQRLEADQSVPILFSCELNDLCENASRLGRDVADKLLAIGTDTLLDRVAV